jgi:hypothetical protein
MIETKVRRLWGYQRHPQQTKKKKGKSSLVEFCRKKREAFFVSQMDLRWNLDKDGMKKINIRYRDEAARALSDRCYSCRNSYYKNDNHIIRIT